MVSTKRIQARKDDEQEVFYTTALTPEMANGYIQGSKPVVLEGGEYDVLV
jgi:AraC family transcriptional activator of mar-sox-rob regulon